MNRFIIDLPVATVTGGPEALHQLGRCLLDLGYEVGLSPLSNPTVKGSPSAFAHYDVPWIPAGAVQSEDNIVCAEMAPWPLQSPRKGRRILWWLSVDNSPMFRSHRDLIKCRAGENNLSATKIASLLKSMAAEKVRRLYFSNKNIEHWAQSTYAHQIITQRINKKVSIVTDYINYDCPEFTSSQLRPFDVAFLKSKSPLAVELKELMTNIKWVEIHDMSPSEVRAALNSTKMFLDLGWHPGKDRMPREAALSGCLVLVAARGAAAHYSDMPIPREHLLKHSGWRLLHESQIKIPALLSDLTNNKDSQEFYRSMIKKQRRRFYEEVQIAVGL